MTPPARRRFRRDMQHRMIGGVCAGLANGLGVDPTLVRVAFALSVFLPGPQVLLYVILWIVMPPDDAP